MELRLISPPDMFRLVAFSVLCVLLLPAVGIAQQPLAKVSYEALLERVKKQDPAVNFKELRLAYTESSGYNPYGGDREARKTMLSALKAKEFDKALESSNDILKANYLDLVAHFAALTAERELGNTDKSEYHKYVMQGLLKSISNSGDGKSMETAFVVISIDEEYALFNFMGLPVTAQTLVGDNGHHYDKMTAVDPKTDQSSTYYFNIDKPFNWLGNSLKK